MIARKRSDGESTRKRIIAAAAKEFTQRGFDAAQISEIAARARVSKQLVHHHFRSKEKLFSEVHALMFRATIEWQETLPVDPANLIASRFLTRVKAPAYVRFLTWEAASSRNRTVPGEEERCQRIAHYGAALSDMQKQGALPADMNHRFVQLAIMSLATYPLAFSRITRLVVGRSGTDPVFQREWTQFLRTLGERLFGDASMPSTTPATKSASRHELPRKKARLRHPDTGLTRNQATTRQRGKL